MQHAATEDALPTRELPRAWVSLLLLLLMVAGTYLRLQGTGVYYYNADEAMHTGIAQAANLTQVLAFSHDEIHPPILYIFVHYWMMISADPAFVRSLLLVFGIATIPVYYLIGRALNDSFTGLCCAALITFSQGCIIQSFVVRQYMIMIFFISLAFYCYLLWRPRHSNRLLLCYGFFSLLACFTHFSAIFNVACVAAYEGLGLLRRRELRQLVRWVAVNAIVGLAALYVYILWQPILVPLKSYFVTHLSGSLFSLLVHTLFYPLATSGYVLPGYTAALLVLIGEIGIAAAAPSFITDLPGLRRLLKLAALAYGFGMLLVITRLYPEPGTRHSIWILPFVVLPAGWLLADTTCWVALKTKSSLPVVATVLILAGVLSYSSSARFDESSEYTWKQEQWDAFSKYLSTLGPRDLIVTEKDDGIMLANLYRNIGDRAFNGKSMAALTPYRDTYILFNPYYPRNYSTDVFLSTLQEAKGRHMFDGIDRLVFIRMTWSRSPLTDLMLCPALSETLITFPPGSRTRDGLAAARAAVMIIPKQELLDDILPQNGKARACLKGMHDMVPGFIHGTP